jgi:hypothetical protein
MKNVAQKGLLLGALAASPWAFAQGDNSNFEMYGFAQLDAIIDFGRMDPAWKDTVRPSKIDAQGNRFGDDGEAILSIRQSRLGFKGDIPNGAKAAKIWIEWDYFGGTAEDPQLQLRHFFVEFEQFGAGKTWTGFMDPDIFPNTIDYWGPNGMVFIRKEQLRYRMELSEGSHLYFTVEDPDADVDASGSLAPVASLPMQSKSILPDFTARLRQDKDWGHWQVAGILRFLEVEVPNADYDGTALGFGINATTVFSAVGEDKVKLGLVLGQGIASNMNDGGNSMALGTPSATDPDVKALSSLGISAFYDRYWSEQWSSSFGFSVHQQNNSDGQLGTAYKGGQLAQANLLYTEGALVTGAELIWARLSTENSNSNKDLRIQYTVKYNFSHIF